MIRVLILTIAMIAGVSAASAQSDMDRVQVQAAWAHEVGQFSVSTISFFGATDQASDIVARHGAGELSIEQALAELDAWRAAVDAQIATMRATADRLSQGPALTIVGQEQVVALMREQPEDVLNVVVDFVGATDVFLRAAVNGEEPDGNAYVASQYGVLQAYTAGNGALNSLAVDSVASNHPQHHLLKSWVANSTATVLALELARQELGGEASIYSVADYPAEISRLNGIVQMAAIEGRAATLDFQGQVSTALAAATSEAERSQMSVVGEMMATYEESFAAELYGIEVLSEMITYSRPLSAPDEFNAFMERLAAYETQRDGLQLQRQQIAARLQ
jgi:hypothetical protein